MRKSYLTIGVLSVLVLSLVIGTVLPGVAQATSKPGSLEVTGTAIVTGAPDMAHISLGVETQDTSADTAAQENANRMDRVFAVLKDLGLTDKDITTSGYNIYSSNQVINRGTDEEATITTYRVQNRVNITTKNLDSVGEIVDAAVKAGANQVHGIRFDIEDKQTMQLQALENAVQQGISKAEAMAEAAGLTLGGIASLNENYSSHAPMVSTMAFRADTEASTTINPGDVEVSATVQLNFWF